MMKTLIAAMSEMPYGFAIVTKDGKITCWNKSLADITGITPENAKDKFVWEIQAMLMPSVYKGDYLESQKKFWQSANPEKLFAIGIKKTQELELVLLNGDLISVCLNYYTTKLNKNETIVCVVVRDLTQQKQKEAELERQGRSAIHDIKTPINAVVGFANLLLEEMTSETSELCKPESLGSIIQIIRASGTRAINLLNKSLILARLELGFNNFPKERLNLNLFVADLQNEFPTIEKRYRVKIGLAFNPTTDKNFSFLADQDLLRSVIDNLLINAVEAASPENKAVSITVEVKDWLSFIISNSGDIPQAIRPNLFKKYASFGKANGNGLGLYNAKLITEAHGGRITYLSEKGTTLFLIQIPLK